MPEIYVDGFGNDKTAYVYELEKKVKLLEQQVLEFEKAEKQVKAEPVKASLKKETGKWQR